MQDKLIDYIQDAHAMEMNVRTMLQSMIRATDDPTMKRRLEQHLDETKQHADRLEGRLKSLEAGTSMRKQAEALAPTFIKGMVDQVRTDKPGKNARDGYVTEHVEIAAYELLERLADRVGDEQTAKVARENRADEERMAKFIASKWDRVLDLTLEEAAA